jgi:hypothetical protein
VIVHPHVNLHSSAKEADSDENPFEELDQLRFDRPCTMRQELATDLHPYVLLNYLPLSKPADKPVPLAVVFHRNSAPIIIIRHNWQVSLDARDDKYLSELMDAWMSTPPERVLALFRQLERLSAGSLRATVSGIVRAEGLENLVCAVLGGGGAFGQLSM